MGPMDHCMVWGVVSVGAGTCSAGVWFVLFFAVFYVFPVVFCVVTAQHKIGPLRVPLVLFFWLWGHAFVCWP